MAIRTKAINGSEYLYYIYSANGKKTDVYCGPSSKPESRKKALNYEIDNLKKLATEISNKIKSMEKEVKNL